MKYEPIQVKTSTAAEMLSIKPKQVLVLVHSGHLNANGVGSGLRISVSSIEAYQEMRANSNYTPPGYIYIARLGVYHKIGMAQDVRARMRALSIGHPEKIELVHTILTNNMRRAETMLHKKYADKRRRGEWFDLSTDELHEIAKYEALMF